MRFLATVIAAGALVGATPYRANSALWGERGHRIVGRLAAEAMPPETPAFFRAAGARLEYLNSEPDRWRDAREQALDPALNLAFSTDHYVQLEHVPPGALRARSRFEYLDSLRLGGGRKPNPGFLPFAILEGTQRLRVDFRRWRQAADSSERAWIEQRIVDDAGVLGHYVADAANPHHTTEHNDGWVGDNSAGYTRGPFFHSRFETQFVDARIQAGDVPRPRSPARTLTDLRGAIIAYLEQSHGQVRRLYDLDKQEPFGPQNVRAEHREFVVARLAAGAEMLRDLWWTAWVTSG